MKSWRETKATAVALSISTRDGEFVARYSEKGLCGLDFPERARASKEEAIPKQVPEQVARWHAITRQALESALNGHAPTNLPPLDLSCGTGFQREVWETLRKIGRGQTWSYGRVAEAIGRPKALRAVGTACGANPIPVFVPCHRVLAANHRLGGFSGGLDWKRRLLEREGIELAA